MGENSAIEWTDHTFNPWVGCTKVSPACDHCYAESWAKRTGHPELWQGSRRRTSASNWRQPVKWNREAAAAGVRYRVFCASLADVFDNQAEDWWRADLWQLIADTPHLTWMLLTKRPQNIAKMLPLDWGDGWPNVWLGTTVENQTEADRRIPQLCSVPAAVRFLSCEPLLGPLDLEWPKSLHPDGPPMCCSGYECSCRGMPAEPPLIYGINWVISGGESGGSARSSHPDWFRSLRDQCAQYGIAYFHKQNGEWAPGECADHPATRAERTAEWFNDDWRFGTITPRMSQETHRDDEPDVYRFGKKAAGATLDGVLHRAFPESPAAPPAAPTASADAGERTP